MAAGELERRNAIRALLRKIVDQFASRTGHRPGDLRQFERLVGDLIDVSDGDSVVAIAETLCRHPETPQALIARLFNRGGLCARIALEFAADAPAAELLANAEHGPAELAAAIARRTNLSREAISALSARMEPVVLHALAANRQARLDPGALRALALVARDDLRLARIMLDREDYDLDPEPLFLAATSEERARIVLSASRSVLIAPVGDLRSDASGLSRAGQELGALLLDLAIAQDRDAIIAKVADALDARKSRVRKIYEDEGGEALALTFVALGVGLDAATKIFLCGDWAFARDIERLRALRALMRSTPPRAALRIVAAINGALRYEREAARRSFAREEGPTQAGAWRRGGVASTPAAESLRALRQEKNG